VLPRDHTYHGRDPLEQGLRARLSRWLCPTELDRRRIVDANSRVRMIRNVASLAVGVALLAAIPMYGWWSLALFALVAADFLTVERRMARSAYPEIVSAVAILNTIVLLAIGVALTGGPTSPGLPWLVMPAAVVAARFRPRVVAAAVGVTVVAILLATVAVHPDAVVDSPSLLGSTLALLIGVVAIVAALQDAELRNRDEAVLDQLTGLLNRHALQPRFEEIRQQAIVTRQPVCVIVCDVDSFKAINDAHGHDVGDAVLRDVAYAIRKGLRSFELVYRLGGEEFLIVLPGIDVDGGEQVAEGVRARVGELRPHGVTVSISAGVSAARGEAVHYDELFKAADKALYEAKRSGRDRVVAARPAERQPFPNWSGRAVQAIPGDHPPIDTTDPSLAG
jgi:diguanylate cyclase (GGDEF)-like protein